MISLADDAFATNDCPKVIERPTLAPFRKDKSAQVVIEEKKYKLFNPPVDQKHIPTYDPKIFKNNKIHLNEELTNDMRDDLNQSVCVYTYRTFGSTKKYHFTLKKTEDEDRRISVRSETMRHSASVDSMAPRIEQAESVMHEPGKKDEIKGRKRSGAMRSSSAPMMNTDPVMESQSFEDFSSKEPMSVPMDTPPPLATLQEEPNQQMPMMEAPLPPPPVLHEDTVPEMPMMVAPPPPPPPSPAPKFTPPPLQDLCLEWPCLLEGMKITKELV